MSENNVIEAEVVKVEKTLPAPSPKTALDLISVATEAGASIEVIERFAVLYEREREDGRRQAFNQSMAEAQAEMRPIATDMTNSQTHSKYASYAQIDSKLRPTYTKHGFGLSFNTEKSEQPCMVRIICVVSHIGGFDRNYGIDMPADGKGAKGNAVMTLTHATGSATAYGMRYLLKMIFNVAVGEYDDDGNGGITDVITPEQVLCLKDLMERAKLTEKRIGQALKFAECESVETIPLKKFDAICATCRKEIKAEEEAEEDCPL